MALETAILTALTGDAAVAAIVGERVRPLAVSPADVRPYLTYQVTGRTSLDTLSDGPADYRKGEFEVGVYADDYAGVMDLSEAVRTRLDDLSVTAGGTELDAYYQSETDVEDATPDGEEAPIYLRVMTFTCLYRAVPA